MCVKLDIYKGHTRMTGQQNIKCLMMTPYESKHVAMWSAIY